MSRRWTLINIDVAAATQVKIPSLTCRIGTSSPHSAACVSSGRAYEEQRGGGRGCGRQRGVLYLRSMPRHVVKLLCGSPNHAVRVSAPSESNERKVHKSLYLQSQSLRRIRPTGIVAAQGGICWKLIASIAEPFFIACRAGCCAKKLVLILSTWQPLGVDASAPLYFGARRRLGGSNNNPHYGGGEGDAYANVFPFLR